MDSEKLLRKAITKQQAGSTVMKGKNPRYPDMQYWADWRIYIQVFYCTDSAIVIPKVEDICIKIKLFIDIYQ